MRGWDRQTADMSVLNNGEKIKIYVHRERTEWKISFRFALGVVRGVVYAFSLLLFFFLHLIGVRSDLDKIRIQVQSTATAVRLLTLAPTLKSLSSQDYPPRR